MTLMTIDSYIEVFLTLAAEKIGSILHSKYTTIINREKHVCALLQKADSTSVC